MDNNKLNNNDYENHSNLDNIIERSTQLKIKSKSYITAQFSNLVSIALIVIAYLMFFTDGKIATPAQLRDLSLLVVALLFVNNAVYNNMIESGQKAAQGTKLYKDAVDGYNAEMVTAKATNSGLERLPEFCDNYNKKALESDRKELLYAAGIKYETYKNNYISKSKRQLKRLKIGDNKALTKSQIKAIKAADRLKSPKLKSEQILRTGQAALSRGALGRAPEQKIKLYRARKVLTSTLVSVLSATIVLDMITDFSFAKFVEATVKVAPILLSAYMGYKTGYNNIYIDSTSYINAQATLINNYIKWLATAPPIKEDILSN